MQDLSSLLRSVDVRIFRLITGEECICRVLEEKDSYYMIERPYVMGIDPTTKAAMPMPFMIMNQAGDPTKLFKNGVMAEFTKMDDVTYNQYVEQTSNIALTP